MNGREYLLFTKRERSGITALVIILLMVVFLPKYFFTSKEKSTRISENDMEKLISYPAERKSYRPYQNQDNNFRLSPQYGNHDYPQYNRKAEYKKEFKRQYSSYYPGLRNSSYHAGERPVRKKEIFEVNIADTSDFISLPGIGSKLASRILLFREKLGGFYDVLQVKEVYGITDSVFRIILPQLKCDSALVRKIDINVASKDLLKLHPYIRWNLANALVAYRSNHGSFSSFEDLAKVNNIDTGTMKKILPYLSFK